MARPPRSSADERAGDERRGRTCRRWWHSRRFLCI